MKNLFVAIFTIVLSVGGWSGSLANGSEVDENCQKKESRKDGWYLITSGKQDSIAKKPILTVEDFAEIKLDSSVVKGNTVYMIIGSIKPDKVKVWANATEKAIGSCIGFVFQNEVICNPRVNARIEGGRFAISQNPSNKSKVNLKKVFQVLENQMQLNAQNSDEYVTIKGRVTDYHNNPLDSVTVFWHNKSFSKNIAKAVTDKNGYYEANVKKGRYYSVGALNMSKYIIAGSKLPDKDLRLEFWGWNFIADRDTTFNMQYHRLEVYGLNIFRIQGGTPAYTIYCRPMSLTRTLAYGLPCKGKVRLAPTPENLNVRVTINDEEVTVLSKQEVEEYWSEMESTNAYILTTSLPKKKNSLPYWIFRVQMTDLENGDMGEATYFLEKVEYEK